MFRFLHSITNVSMFVKFINKKSNINYFILDNGMNTSNEFIAPYTWNIKIFFQNFLVVLKKKFLNDKEF